MIDYSELIEELREQARLDGDYNEDAVIKGLRKAADALEAQAKEIGRLNSIIEGAFQSNLQHCRLQDAQFARIAELEAALKPFANSRHLDGLPVWTDDGAVIGCNFQVRDLRAARAALKGEK